MNAPAEDGMESPMHCTASFEIVVKLPYAEAAPLFGPEGERPWAGPDWDPRFIHPRPGRDEQGAVFTVRQGERDAVWVNTQRDLNGRHFQYVYFLPELLVTTIDVHFRPIDANATAVHVAYARTAITSEGNTHVKRMNAADRTAGPAWQQAIDAYLSAWKTEPGHGHECQGVAVHSRTAHSSRKTTTRPGAKPR